MRWARGDARWRSRWNGWRRNPADATGFSESATVGNSRSGSSVISGKVFCLASGPSRETVMRIHERAGHPTAEVYELQMEV